MPQADFGLVCRADERIDGWRECVVGEGGKVSWNRSVHLGAGTCTSDRRLEIRQISHDRSRFLASGGARMTQTAAMRSSDVVTDKSSREVAETSDAAAGPSDAGTLAAFERRIRLEESAVRRRFRQNIVLAIIFALAALTLVVIVQVGHSA